MLKWLPMNLSHWTIMNKSLSGKCVEGTFNENFHTAKHKVKQSKNYYQPLTVAYTFDCLYTLVLTKDTLGSFWIMHNGGSDDECWDLTSHQKEFLTLLKGVYPDKDIDEVKRLFFAYFYFFCSVHRQFSWNIPDTIWLFWNPCKLSNVKILIESNLNAFTWWTFVHNCLW